MAISKVSICSNALLLLGAAPLSSLEEDTDHARLCLNLYPTVRDDILRLHPWNCATKRLILAPLATPPEFDFGYQFQLPGDWLRTIQVGNKRNPLEYRMEGRKILADTNTLPFVYVFQNTEEATWSSNLVHVVELGMAAKMAYAVTSSASMRDSMRDEFARELKAAKGIDGQDDPPEEFGAGMLVESRF
jgi:hypothetical protein